MVVQLAQLKGLMESQVTPPSGAQEETGQPPLSLSTAEIFSLLDLDQDGFLQKEEVRRRGGLEVGWEIKGWRKSWEMKKCSKSH